MNKLKNRVSELETTQFDYKSELIETERRCERMTDSCLDIIKNKTWQ